MTARLPDPPDDGWKIRTSQLLIGLAAGGHEIDLLSFAGPGDEIRDPSLRAALHETHLVPRTDPYAPRDLLRGLVGRQPFVVLNYARAGYAEAFQRLTSSRRYDVIQVEDIVLAQYVVGSDVPMRILDMHNVESLLMARYASDTRNVFKKLYARITARKLARYEREVADGFQLVVTCSANDRRQLEALGVGTPIRVVPNGVDASRYQDITAATAESDTLLFVGSMDYHANVSAVLDFVGRVLPLIREKRPAVKFVVVGRNPPANVRALESEHVVITGGVPDVRPYLEAASVVVTPLLVGGGTRLKILEAMAAERAVVSTTVGAEGIDADGTVVLADTPSEFAAAVISLLADPEGRADLAERARRVAVERYDWRRITAAYVAAIDAMLPDHPPA